MIRVSEKTLLLFAIAVISGMILVDASSLRNDVALVPRVIGIPLLVLSLGAALVDLVPALGHRLRQRLPRAMQRMFQSAFEDRDVAHAESEEATDYSNVRGRYLMVAWIAATVLAVYFVGLFWASGIAIFIWLKVFSGASWRLAFLYMLGTIVFIYGVFVVGFDYEYFMRPDFPWWRL